MKGVVIATTAAFAAVVLLLCLARAPSSVVPARTESARQKPSDVSGARGSAGLPFLSSQLAERTLSELRVAARGGVLAGVEPDGSWVCAADGGLRPDRRIRERMDWYGNQLGPMSADELALVLSAEAAEACGPKAGQDASQVWRAYQDAMVAVAGVVPADRAALEQSARAAAAARRRGMGPSWAEAFFGDDERLLAAQLAGQGSREVEPLPLPDAAARSAAVDASWASWRQRIEDAQQAVNQLRNDPSLNAEARAGKFHELIEQRFAETERLRAEGLLRPTLGG